MNATPNIFYYYFNLPLFVIQFIKNSLSLKFGCYRDGERDRQREMERETKREGRERWREREETERDRVMERGRDGGRRRCGEELEREEDRRGKRRGWMGMDGKMESHQEGGAREYDRRFWKERGKGEMLTNANREADTAVA
jgi:hypothetical protein